VKLIACIKGKVNLQNDYRDPAYKICYREALIIFFHILRQGFVDDIHFEMRF